MSSEEFDSAMRDKNMTSTSENQTVSPSNVKRSDANYMKQYYHARKAQNPEYYSIYSLKKYYRKQLSLIDANNDARKEKILSKLASLDAKLKDIKDNREKYNRWQRKEAAAIAEGA